MNDCIGFQIHDFLFGVCTAGKTCGCKYGGADRTLPLWWVFYSGLLPTVAGMAPSQKCHAEMYGCDGCKSLRSGIESAVKKLSEPSVLYAFCPPSVRSSSCQILSTTLWNPPLSIPFFWLSLKDFKAPSHAHARSVHWSFLLRLVTMPLYSLLSSRSVLWGLYFISL